MIDNRDLKSTAGTPLSFFGFPSVAGISIQRTAVVFSSPIIITSQAMAGHLNKGVNVKNSKLLPLDEEQGLQINASDVTLLSVRIITGIHPRILFFLQRRTLFLIVLHFILLSLLLSLKDIFNYLLQKTFTLMVV